MNTWLYSLFSVILVSLLSFIGVLFIVIREEKLKKILLLLVSFAAGGLLGDSFLHLLPEAVKEKGFSLEVSLAALAGLLLFFVLEKFISWRHCHIPTSKKHPHPLGLMNLIGDGFHNFIDGMIIAGSFLSSVSLGITTSLAVIFHEIPQEIGDFGVLLYSGFGKTRALIFNFASALMAILGAILVLELGSKITNFTLLIIPFTAGGFIYIAGSDLIPELHKETNLGKSALQLGGLALGIGVMLGLTSFAHQPPPLKEKFVVEEPRGRFVPSKGEKALLPQTKVAYQTFNNCGPATLSMILSYYERQRVTYYGIYKSQKELGKLMRPYQHSRGDNDDKAIFPEEFVEWVQKFGLKALYRPNGSFELIKLFLTNEIPVIVKTWLRPDEDIGHFRILRGFDEKAKVIIEDNSYFGPNQRISYYQFLLMWQPFNYGYIPVYRPEKEETVKAILGEDLDLKIVYQKAATRAKKEAELDPTNVYPVFNLSTSYYHLGEYEKSVAEFEKIESRLPRRMLWYQIEPILAYQKLKDYAQVFQISGWLFTHGNRAFSELYQVRGEIYLKKGDKESARHEFELALKYNINFQPAKEALSQLLLDNTPAELLK